MRFSYFLVSGWVGGLVGGWVGGWAGGVIETIVNSSEFWLLLGLSLKKNT